MSDLRDRVALALDSFNKDEWWDIYRQFNPTATTEQFDADWAEFQRAKAARAERLLVQ
jgi:hypothetical protein